MDSYDTRRVLERGIEAISTPTGLLIVAGSVVAMVILSRKKILKMDTYDQRRVLETAFDKVEDLGI